MSLPVTRLGLLPAMLCDVIVTESNPGLVYRPRVPATWESETGGSQLQGLPGLQSKF